MEESKIDLSSCGVEMDDEKGMGIDRPLPQEEAESILRQVAYWHYPFELPWGRAVTGKRRHDERHQQRRDHFFEPLLQSFGGSLTGKRVLDLGCCQGFWSFEAARAGASSCLGIDSSSSFIEEARALRTVLQVGNCEFRQAHLEDDPWWEGIEPVDICLCLGLFYHLTDPIAVLRRAMELTREVVVLDTQIWTQGWPRATAAPPHNSPALLLVKRNPEEPTTAKSGLASTLRTLLTREALVALLEDGGFASNEVLAAGPAMPREYLVERRISIIARRGAHLSV